MSTKIELPNKCPNCGASFENDATLCGDIWETETGKEWTFSCNSCDENVIEQEVGS